MAVLGAGTQFIMPNYTVTWKLCSERETVVVLDIVHIQIYA